MRPLEEVAGKEGVTVDKIRDFLAEFGIDINTDRSVHRHPLRLTRIAFDGTKTSNNESGPFSFDHAFERGCTAIVSDRNLTGKTSIIAIAKWAFRGAPDSDLSNNVREWLENVVVEGVVDELPFAVEFEAQTSRGKLIVGERSAAATTEFDGASDFADVMEAFFDQRLELPAIPSFQQNDRGGTEVNNGWRAYLGTIWISDARDDLLLGETTFAALPSRLLNMFVAVPYAEGAYALGQAVKKMEARAAMLSRDPTAEARSARAGEIELELERLRLEAKSVDDPVESARRVKQTTTAWREADQRLIAAQRRLNDVTEEHNDAAGELQLLRRNAAAGRVLSTLEPSRCPRCTSPVEPTTSDGENHCYVCTHPEPESLDDADDPIVPLTNEVGQLKATMTELEGEVALLQSARDNAEIAMTGAQRSLNELSSGGGLDELVSIARLEGELSSLTQDFGKRTEAESVAEELRLLKAIQRAVDSARKSEAVERFAAIDELLVSLLHRLGFRDAVKAHLLANGGLEITFASGVTSPFKKLQDGEKVRARIATMVAMLTVDGTRHPGLIVYDSLADKEVNDVDLAALLGALNELAAEHDVQVVVTHTGESVAAEALGEECILGPSSPAGHIF